MEKKTDNMRTPLLQRTQQRSAIGSSPRKKFNPEDNQTINDLVVTFNDGQSRADDNLIREYLIRYISVNCPTQKPSFAKPTESSLREWMQLSRQLFEFCTQENIYPQLQALAAPANSGHLTLSSSPSAVLNSESPPQTEEMLRNVVAEGNVIREGRELDDLLTNAANPQSQSQQTDSARSNTTSSNGWCWPFC